MIISDFKPVFLVLGGLVTKSAFSKTNPIFLDDFFDTKLILWQHPQQVFCYFHHFLSITFKKRITFSKIWMFLHHHWKFGSFSLKIGGELICQSWALQTSFSQLSHSALQEYFKQQQKSSGQLPPTVDQSWTFNTASHVTPLGFEK